MDHHAGRTTVEDHAWGWLRGHARLAKRTGEIYESQLRLHILPRIDPSVPALGTVAVADVTPALIRQWYAALVTHHSPSVAAKAYTRLRQVLGAAVDDELIAKNPCRIERGGAEHPPEQRVATMAELASLAGSVPDRYRTLVLAAGLAGLRQGELFALRWDDVDRPGAVRPKRLRLASGEVIEATRRAGPAGAPLRFPPSSLPKWSAIGPGTAPAPTATSSPPRMGCRWSAATSATDVEARASLDDALGELEARAEAVGAALASVGCTTTAQARAAGVTPDAWSPVVLIADEPANDLQQHRLQGLTGRTASAVAAVLPGPASAGPMGRVLEVDDRGGLRVEGIDVPLTARRLDRHDIALLGHLLDDAERPPVPAAEVEEVPPPTPRAPRTASRPSPLQDLLAEVDVLVRVLGEVEAVRLGPEGEERLGVPKQKSLEAIAYLALREGPVDREDLQAALWPAGDNSAKTFHNTVWAARRALGVDRDGAESFPEPTEGRYDLSPRVVTDYGLFHELATRAGELEDPAETAAFLADALGLVRAEPFVGVGRGYAWVAPHAGIIVAEVIDAAEQLAELRLAAGDRRGAEWAARQGLRIFPCDERLYRVLMRCADAAGTLPGVQRAFQELAAKLADPDLGVEPEATIHPHTIALLERLTAPSRPGPASA